MSGPHGFGDKNVHEKQADIIIYEYKRTKNMSAIKIKKM